jgi:hypothetical protein
LNGKRRRNVMIYAVVVGMVMVRWRTISRLSPTLYTYFLESIFSAFVFVSRYWTAFDARGY